MKKLIVLLSVLFASPLFGVRPGVPQWAPGVKLRKTVPFSVAKAKQFAKLIRDKVEGGLTLAQAIADVEALPDWKHLSDADKQQVSIEYFFMVPGSLIAEQLGVSHRLSIQDHLDHGANPGDFVVGGVLTLERGKLTSLEGLQEFIKRLGELAQEVVELNLRANEIRRLDPGVFQGFDNLKTLNLGGNRITTLRLGALKGLGKLETLYLASNRITTVEPGALQDAGNLIKLSLSSNRFTTLKSGVLKGLGKLETLYLSDNQITTAEPAAFNGLAKLSWITLFNNPISEPEREKITQMVRKVSPQAQIQF